MKEFKLICEIFFISIILTLLFSCIHGEDDTDTSSLSMSENPAEISENESSSASIEESSPSYEDLYEVDLILGDGNLYVYKKNDEDSKHKFYYALVTSENEILYDFDEKISDVTEATEDRLVLTKFDENDELTSSLIDINGNAIIPFGEFKTLNVDEAWGYGERKDGIWKFFNSRNGSFLKEDFGFVYNAFNGQYFVDLYNNGGYLLLLNDDGTYELVEYDLDVAIEEHGDKINAVLTDIISAIMDNDDEMLKEYLSESAFANYQAALDDEAVKASTLDDAHKFKGAEFLAVLSNNRKHLTGKIEIEEFTVVHIEKGRYSSGLVYIDSNSGDYISVTFAVLSEGEGNFTLTWISNGYVE